MAKRILIIGGGVSGCYLAAIFAERGAEVTLVERAGHLGGRAAVLQEPQTGDLLELGPHLLMGCYSSFRRFTDKIGATGRLRFQDDLSMPFRVSSERTLRFACPRFPAPLHVAAALMRFSRLSVWDRLSGLRIGPELLRRKWFGSDPLDSETAWVWLRRCGQTPEICRTLWQPLCEAALNLPLEKGSAKLMANVLVEAFCRSRADSSLGWVTGGIGSLCDTDARQFIESHGGRVLTRVNVESLLSGNEQVTGVVLSTGQRIEADAVVSTIAPWDLLALLKRSDLSQSPPVESIGRFEPSPILTLNLWLDCEITDEHFIHLEGRRFQWLFDNRKHLGATASVSPPSVGEKSGGSIQTTPSMSPPSVGEKSGGSIQTTPSVSPPSVGEKSGGSIQTTPSVSPPSVGEKSGGSIQTTPSVSPPSVGEKSGGSIETTASVSPPSVGEKSGGSIQTTPSVSPPSVGEKSGGSIQTTPSVSPPSVGEKSGGSIETTASVSPPSVGEKSGGCYSLLISGPSILNGCSKEELVRLAMEDVRGLFPVARSARVLKASVSRQRRATYAPYPNMEPFRPEPGQWLKGLYLAGDWTATGLPCTLESGCRSVEMSAKRVMLQGTL